MSWYLSSHQFYINESVERSIPQIRELYSSNNELKDSNNELKEIVKKQDQAIKELFEAVLALKARLEDLNENASESASGTDKK